MKTCLRWICCWIIVAPLAWQCAPAEALIVAPPASNDNASAPADDPGWLSVGDRGVYLGNLWVITAYHVGSGTITFPGLPGNDTFANVPGSEVRLKNPDSTEADLLLFRLATDPGLSWLSIASVTPAIDAEVTLIGDGGAVNPSDDESYWNVTGTDPDFTWTEVGINDPHNASGYKSTTFRKLWGTNRVEDDQDFFENESEADGDFDHTVLIDDNFGLTISFFSEFDKEDETEGLATLHEAQAQSEDSGSAAFAKEEGNWVLAGVTYAVGAFEDQPSPGVNAVFGNLTFVGDLSRYRNEILSVTGVPELSGFWLVGGVGALVGLLRLALRRDRAC